MGTPPLAVYLHTAMTVAAVAVCYRFVISPAVRGIARRSAAVILVAGVPPAVLPAFLPPPEPGPIRWFVMFVIALLTWQGTTSDYDVTEPMGPQRLDKQLLLALGAAACFWPPALLAWMGVYCGRLRGWKHHAMMPLRLLKAYLAWFLAMAFLEASSSAAALVLVLGCVSFSHYVKPAWSKARLGPRPWSWAWHNRTHYLMASAYAWGWARFLRPETVSRVLRHARGLDRPVNVLTMMTEAVGLVAFLDRRLLIAALVATALFNVAVALASGILFWENISVNVALAITMGLLPDAAYGTAFGWPAALLALVMLILSASDLLWQPWHLGWWDSPFTARIHWQVETASGRRMGLYNDFMCPYEREFGRILGYFLTSEPVLHDHLGIVWDRKLRDLILQADGDPETLRRLRETYGRVRKDEQQAKEHIAFLTTMFNRLNHGARKGPVPRSLRRLKAPGGQLYQWGDLPPYRGDEPVRRITIRYEERCYRPSTGDLVRLTDHVVHEIDLL
ncbi:hypothetical protein I3J09_15300 [Streptomyces clavuligerus]|uniref:Uncharacterized protein n=2 Tax=Streptomyces clavuligerus TaxID=1901 RepID=B5GT99_STRCL|nr:hypothetical protein BB341_15120 [Streptomyces clavuligerus]AXU14060.1 hypothetical protein D1794_15765 [Streptomyces clavuligerus]EDY49580.1 hypothetical protein SSCG_02608 [Streptomyces clavuligerus]EFG07750.1 Hypothetical protein SCLAV_2678 [Streptomyces clavuligerus]MBY6304043.1 hypothetical protein [Streptomyces clavuligerus]